MAISTARPMLCIVLACSLAAFAAAGTCPSGICPNVAPASCSIDACPNCQYTCSCTPATTCPAGKICGTAPDSCGGTINCGPCISPNRCSEDGTTCSCTPATTCPAGKICGTAPDGCGGTINCGPCISPNRCSEDGTTCSCTPATTCPEGKTCGTASDGCGGTINCGTCTDGTCTDGNCVSNCKDMCVDGSGVAGVCRSTRPDPLNGVPYFEGQVGFCAKAGQPASACSLKCYVPTNKLCESTSGKCDNGECRCYVVKANVKGGSCKANNFVVVAGDPIPTVSNGGGCNESKCNAAAKKLAVPGFGACCPTTGTICTA